MRSHKSKSPKSGSRASWLRVKLLIWFTQFEFGETRDVEDNVIGTLTLLECTDTCWTLAEVMGRPNLGMDWGRAEDMSDLLSWVCFSEMWAGQLFWGQFEWSKVNRLSGEIKGVCGGTSWKEQKFRDKSSGFDFTMDELWESYMGKYEWVSVSSPKKWNGTKLLHEDPFHGLKGEWEMRKKIQ